MLAIFAQANDDAGAVAGAGFFVMLMVFFGVMLLVAMLPTIFFLLTLQKTLSRCSARNRTQEPGMVWIALIPLVGMVWSFINVLKVAESLENEFRERGWHRRGEDYGKTLGITTFALALGGLIPYCGILFGLAAFICWIIYWIKVAGFSTELVSGRSNYNDDDDEDDDDRPRRRRNRDDDDDDDEDDRGKRKPWDRDR